MRLWSLHPSLLDQKGLGAAWREALLAKACLEGKTVGYRNHPQLQRFKETSDPLAYINKYLCGIRFEATLRGYNYDISKIDTFTPDLPKMKVTISQLTYEIEHLCKKFEKRCPQLMDRLEFKAHPLFEIIPGEIASWEITK